MYQSPVIDVVIFFCLTFRLQYRMNPSKSSVFYLERVGFEAKVNYRHNLKNGPNTIGRTDTRGVDIAINSYNCSRRHCVLDVSDDQITVEDLKVSVFSEFTQLTRVHNLLSFSFEQSSNGTTHNGTKLMGEKATVNEGDIIGIVGGLYPPSEWTGNHALVVYRICKYTSDNIQTFEIEDDDDPIELSDNDEDNDVICLDSDGELVDPNEADDLDIHLSREFNLEIKKELMDFDDNWEELTLHVKTEPVELTSDKIDENYELGECSNQAQPNDVPVDNGDNNSGNESDDSTETVYFPAIHQTNCVSPDNGDKAAPSSDRTSSASNGTVHSPAIHEQNCDSPDNADKVAPLSDQTNLDSKKVKKPQLNQQLQAVVSKINESEENRRKRGPDLIYAKPLQKRRKSSKSEGSTGRSKQEKDAKEERKERLKATASTSPKRDESDCNKPSTSTHTTPKVKFTPNNRGSFLTDATQMPLSPKIILKQRKEEKLIEEMTRNAEKPSVHKPDLGEVLPEVVTPTPADLEKKIWENMHASKASQMEQVSPVKEKNLTLFIGNSSQLHEMAVMENEDSGTCEIDSPTNSHDDEIDRIADFIDDGVGMDIDETEANDDDYDDTIDMYELVMKLPPDTGKVIVVETNPKPAHIKSILKTSTNAEPKKNRRVIFKEESGFQYDPRHKIISDITAYDCSQFESVEAFCKSVNTDIRSFADSYDDYEEYRK